jgi:hypothetical protein
MVGDNHKVEENRKGDADFGDEMILTHTKNEKSHTGQKIFHEEETHMSLLDEKVHEGIEFLGAPFNQENRKTCIQNR